MEHQLVGKAHIFRLVFFLGCLGEIFQRRNDSLVFPSISESFAFNLSVMARTLFIFAVSFPPAKKDNNPNGDNAYSSSFTKWRCMSLEPLW